MKHVLLKGCTNNTKQFDEMAMKRILLTGLLFVVLGLRPACAQSQEAQQLLLNWEKLRQLEEILDNMAKHL